jgi:hypothetical protein
MYEPVDLEIARTLTDDPAVQEQLAARMWETTQQAKREAEEAGRRIMAERAAAERTQRGIARRIVDAAPSILPFPR